MHTSFFSPGRAFTEISPGSARRLRLELQSLKKRKTSAGSGSSIVKSSSKPAEPSIGPPVQKSCPSYGFKSVCGRRQDMEDVVSVHPQFFGKDGKAEDKWDFYGVFDGHGCSHVAVSCKNRMHEIVAEELAGVVSLPRPLSVVNWKRIMERSFHQMDVEAVDFCEVGCDARCMSFRCLFDLPTCEHVGSTAVVAVVGNDHIVVANCGDSRAVLCRSGNPVPLSVDQKPDRPDELQRIEAAGGRVTYSKVARVLGVLAMSRAIGDGHLKPYVIAVPEVTVTARSGDDECLILASDGLWDVVTNQKACDIARRCLWKNQPIDSHVDQMIGGADKRCSDAALMLTEFALAEQSMDNVSVVVVDLRRGRRF